MLTSIRKNMNHHFINLYVKGFEDGAYSEKEIFIEKACEYLKKELQELNGLVACDAIDKFIEAFRKEMEF